MGSASVILLIGVTYRQVDVNPGTASRCSDVKESNYAQEKILDSMSNHERQVRIELIECSIQPFQLSTVEVI
jgi:hypothetical protein